MGRMGPMGHHTAPQAHAVAASVIIGHMRPIPWDPFGPSGSSERACGHHPWGSPDDAHGSRGPPTLSHKPTQLLRLSSLAPHDPSHGTHFGRPGSSQRARGLHGHHGPHSKWRHVPHGTHPNGSHRVISGPMGLTRWGP